MNERRKHGITVVLVFLLVVVLYAVLSIWKSSLDYRAVEEASSMIIAP